VNCGKKKRREGRERKILSAARKKKREKLSSLRTGVISLLNEGGYLSHAEKEGRMVTGLSKDSNI